MNRNGAVNPQLTRRGLLAAGGAVVLGTVGGCAAATSGPAEVGDLATPAAPASPTASAVETATAATAPASATRAISFYGQHQAGVETAPATWQTFLGLDLAHGHGQAARNDGEALLRLVSDDAARLTAGEAALGDTEPQLAADPANLTITVGLGRPFFRKTDTFEQMPEQLAVIPKFTTDAFEDPWGQTDVLLQVGCDDPLVLSHAIRMLTKDTSTVAHVRWTQPGFRSGVPSNPGSATTRNLMGQVDGTINPAAGTADFESIVWIDQPGRWQGGTILVLRRIRMLLDTWDALDPTTKEVVIGRTLDTGAPLGGTSETDPVPFDAVDSDGLPVIPADSHIAVAHATTAAESILRRPYSYDNGMRDGTNDMGLLFAAYMRDPRTSYIPMQKRLASSDAFNRWNTTIGSASYALPPGAAEGGYIAEGLFA